MFRWYAIHTYSGHEDKVRRNLEQRRRTQQGGDDIRRIVVPTEQIVETRDGKKVEKESRVLPGYVLVQMDATPECVSLVRNTPGVTGFVGQSQKGQKPTPLSRREVETFLTAKGDGQEAPKRKAPKLEYEVGEGVRVKEGPFADFSGQVAEINADHMKLKVLVNIFGRETLVEMDFSQVAKL